MGIDLFFLIRAILNVRAPFCLSSIDVILFQWLFVLLSGTSTEKSPAFYVMNLYFNWGVFLLTAVLTNVFPGNVKISCTQASESFIE